MKVFLTRCGIMILMWVLKELIFAPKYLDLIWPIIEVKILNVASDLGIVAPNQDLYNKEKFIKPVTYSVVKHGIIGLTKYTASYWAKKNIRCNAIAPGGMSNNQIKIL